MPNEMYNYYNCRVTYNIQKIVTEFKEKKTHPFTIQQFSIYSALIKALTSKYSYICFQGQNLAS